MKTRPFSEIRTAAEIISLPLLRLPSANFFSGQLQWINAEDGSPRKLPAAVRAQGNLQFHPDGKRLLGRFSKESAPDRLAWLDLESGALAAVEGLAQNWQTLRMP